MPHSTRKRFTGSFSDPSHSSTSRYSRTARGGVVRLYGAAVPVCLGCGVLLIGVRLDQAGIRRKALAADQPLRDAARHHRFKEMAQQITVAETTVAVFGKGGMIRHAVCQIETAKPSICKIEMHFLAQPALRSDAQTVPNQQHPDQQFRVNRRTARIAVKWCKVLTDTRQIHKPVN